MLTSVSHLFLHLVLVGLQEFVGGRERRAVGRVSTTGVRGNKDEIGPCSVSSGLMLLV